MNRKWPPHPFGTPARHDASTCRACIKGEWAPSAGATTLELRSPLDRHVEAHSAGKGPLRVGVPATVGELAHVDITITSPIRHQCPHRDEIDELHALKAYLDGYRHTAMSHEQITDRIQHDLQAAHGIKDVTVSSAWNTAGMEVSCSTSPTRVGQP